MRPSSPLLSLKGELSKLARLTNVQSGLPPILKVAPVIAIAVAQRLPKTADGRNFIEDRILGTSEAIFLSSPVITESRVKANRFGIRAGVQSMCNLCNSDMQLERSRQILRSLQSTGLYSNWWHKDANLRRLRAQLAK